MLVTFLFEAVNFLVLAWVLGWLFFKPIRSALEKRKLELLSETNEATQRLADAARMQSEAERRQSELQKELDSERERAKADAEADAQKIRDEAHAAADRERERLRTELSTLKDSHLDDLSSVVALAASDAVRTLLIRIAGPELDRALIRSACQELNSLNKDLLEPVNVETARTLADEEREQLFQSLGKAASTAAIGVAPRLGGGIRVATSQGLIDASVSGLAAYARRAVIERLNQHSSNGTTDDSAPMPKSASNGSGT